MIRKNTNKDCGKIIKEKKDAFEFIKFLTKWLCQKNRNLEELQKKIDESLEKNNKNFIIKRAFSYSYNNPHIIWYFNKYLNNKFSFYYLDILEVLNSIAVIMEMNNFNDNRLLCFIKSTDLKDDERSKIKKVIKEYFNIILNKFINDFELEFLYSLFKKEIISKNDISEMNSLINGEEIQFEKKEKNEEPEIDVSAIVEELKFKELSPEISNFQNELISIKKERKECQNCKLFEKEMVVLDTNMTTFGQVDFAFFNINPSSDDVMFGKSMSGKIGDIWRAKIARLPKNLKWVVSNVIFCQTNSQKEIGKKDKDILNVSKNCSQFIMKIFEKFPAKYYIPMGNIPASIFGLQGSILSKSGILEEINGCKIIPLVNPSAFIYEKNGNVEKAFNLGFESIYQIANQLYKNESIQDTPEVKKEPERKEPEKKKEKSYTKQSSKYDGVNMIDEITDNLTLFDINNLDNNRVLMVFLDENGDKSYKIIKYEIPIIINSFSWDCAEILTNKAEFITYINGQKRYELLQALRDNLNITKRGI